VLCLFTTIIVYVIKPMKASACLFKSNYALQNSWEYTQSLEIKIWW